VCAFWLWSWLCFAIASGNFLYLKRGSGTNDLGRGNAYDLLVVPHEATNPGASRAGVALCSPLSSPSPLPPPSPIPLPSPSRSALQCGALGVHGVASPCPHPAPLFSLPHFYHVTFRSTADYYTFSRAGVTHFVGKGESEFTSLEQWEREYRLFGQLHAIPFFAKYRFVHSPPWCGVAWNPTRTSTFQE
jgi:hypothetical protein